MEQLAVQYNIEIVDLVVGLLGFFGSIALALVALWIALHNSDGAKQLKQLDIEKDKQEALINYYIRDALRTLIAHLNEVALFATIAAQSKPELDSVFGKVGADTLKLNHWLTGDWRKAIAAIHEIVGPVHGGIEGMTVGDFVPFVSDMFVRSGVPPEKVCEGIRTKTYSAIFIYGRLRDSLYKAIDNGALTLTDLQNDKSVQNAIGIMVLADFSKNEDELSEYVSEQFYKLNVLENARELGNSE